MSAASRRDAMTTTRQPILIDTIAGLRARVREWRRAGERVGLVPTMGALHRGHVSLMQQMARAADRVVVSIFVNPAQFAPTEDFARYPRTLEADLAAMRAADVDAVFTPGVSEIYPDGFSTSIVPAGPAAVGLEDRFRPTHFAGVAVVVTKLLNQVQPDLAIFGEKDFQQLAVLRRVCRDLDLPVEVVGAETVREPDGLALSSRNAYLAADERVVAPVLYNTLSECAQAIASSSEAESAMQRGRDAIVGAGFELDYLEARDAVTLEPWTPGAGAPRILVAARIGRTRLIDNIGLDEAD